MTAFQDFNARTEIEYAGQRADGTHEIDGTIYLETRSDHVHCSFNAARDKLVGYFAGSKTWPGYALAGASLSEGDTLKVQKCPFL